MPSISKVLYIVKEKEIYLPIREYISGHISVRINMVANYILYMHITTVLKAYCLPVTYM